MKNVIAIPSFWGIPLYSVFFLLYKSRVFNYDQTTLETNILIYFTLLSFIISTIINYKRYSTRITINGLSIKNHLKTNTPIYTILIFYSIGFIGNILYIKEIVKYFGSITNTINIFSDSSYLIRQSSAEFTGFSIQLTYFSWIASAMTIFFIYTKKISPLWSILYLINLLMNIAFIDRTRPIWILFTTNLVILPFVINKVKVWLISLRILLIVILFGFLFNFIGIWIGKINDNKNFGKTSIPSFAQDLCFYGTGSFAYLNKITLTENVFEYHPDRSLFTFYKLLSTIKIVNEPPSRINEFKVVIPDTQVETNVGTFIEPFYRDGGLPYAIIGILIHSFLFDYLGYIFLKKRSAISLYGWSNLCFCNFISFFTPKFVTFPFILFVFVALIYKRD